MSSKNESPMIKTLRAEHRHMANILNLLNDQLELLGAGQHVDAHVLYEIMEYVTTWPDRYHHPREDIIYSRVAELDANAADDVDTLQRDHDVTAKKGKKLLKAIAGWQTGEVNEKRLIKQAKEYVTHIFEHMNVEEEVVFPHIESILTPSDWRELAEDDSLKAVSAPLFGTPVQREYRNVARKLRRRTRKAVEHAALSQWVSVETTMESVEVLSLAFDCARYSATNRIGGALSDSFRYFQQTPIIAPTRCAVNNVKVSLALIGDLVSICGETANDLSQVRQSHRNRVKFLERQPETNKYLPQDCSQATK
ncbi:MAG: hemerythrin domain-containing protein [Halioglobus sp.]